MKTALESLRAAAKQHTGKRRIVVVGPSQADQLRDAVRAELAPMKGLIEAQQAEIEDGRGEAFRMAAEIAQRLQLPPKEQRVYDALLSTCGNDLATAQSLVERYGKGKGYSRANIQRIRETLERKLAANGIKNPRVFWAKSHPLASTTQQRPGKKTGTMPGL